MPLLELVVMASSAREMRAPYHFLDITDRKLVKKARALIDAGAPFAVRSPHTYKYQDHLRRTFARPYTAPDDGRSILRVLLDSWGSMDAIACRVHALDSGKYAESVVEDAEGICIYYR